MQSKQEIFNLLDKTGVFDVRNGKAIINFDDVGSIQEIKFDVVRYKRGKPVIIIRSLT